jgi:hypothetical protein
MGLVRVLRTDVDEHRFCDADCYLKECDHEDKG